MLAEPLAELFNQSLASGRIAEDWRCATVVPIFKSGERARVGNYRPINLTSILLKVMERVLKAHLLAWFDNQSLISCHQHGFRARRSCTTNLILFMEEVTKRLDQKQEVEVCYLDFQKAFDSVNHRLLIEVLSSAGVNDGVVRWIADFLGNRTFKVRIGDQLSEEAVVISGVPQGSVLGPLLFILYVDSIFTRFKGKAFAFADDLKIVCKVSEISEDMGSALEWSREWDLPINLSKSCILSTLNAALELEPGLELNRVAQCRDLGTMVTSDFKPRLQCRAAAKKANGAWHHVRRSVVSRRANVIIPCTEAKSAPTWSSSYGPGAPTYSRTRMRWKLSSAGLPRLCLAAVNYPTLIG